jgi:hypothetical protein
LFIGEDVDVSESYQIHPTLLFSYPPTRMFETTAAVKLLYIFKEVRDECLLAINLGCGISHAPERYWLRPEVGWSYDFDHGWINMYFGVGLSLMLLK